MKHLLHMRTSTREPKRKSRRIADLGGKCFLCYQINGYWFRLSYSQWAEFRNIIPSLITNRIASGKTIEQILGYEPIIKKRNK